MIRLFCAIDLPDPLKQRLSLLMGGVPGAKWVAPENLHVTLSFIGEVAEDRMADIDDALARVRAAPFDLTLAGMGSFQRGREVTAIWAGLERSEPLMDLQARVEQSLAREGFPSERRKYSPHVTLARLKGASDARVAAYIAANNLFRAPPFRVEDFVLFSSFLSSSGSIYTPEAEYPLDGRANARSATYAP